ncbi:MAG: hypothetical protein MUF54_16665 [Polyangiaceae bacterium]|nr:hypothetical protein [Polyangiaceae bacterium]
MTREVACQLGSRAAGAAVAGAQLQSDTTAPRGPALVGRLTALIAGAIGPDARSLRAPVSMELARADAAACAILVYVQTELAQGELRVTADVYPMPRNIWDRSRNPSPGPVAHAFASARIDAEVRTFLAPIPLVATAPYRVPLPETEVLALSCDDLDQDGALEISMLSRRNLSVVRIRQGRVDTLRNVPWHQLSPIAPVPWREPLATLAVSQTGTIDAGITDRAASVRLDAALQQRASFPGMPVPVPRGRACASRRVGSLTAELSSCAMGDPAPTLRSAPFPFDAFASARIIGADGSERDVWASRSPTDGTVAIADDRGAKANLPNVGAQLAVADVDLDGDPDLIVSRNVLQASRDALAVHSWRRKGTLQQRFEVDVPDGVAAVTVCPPDSAGPRAIAMATTKELWLLR